MPTGPPCGLAPSFRCMTAWIVVLVFCGLLAVSQLPLKTDSWLSALKRLLHINHAAPGTHHRQAPWRPRSTHAEVTGSSIPTVFVTTPAVQRRVTAGGCQLQDVYSFVYGHQQKKPVAVQSKCDSTPPGLVGSIKVHICGASISELEDLGFSLEQGGHYRPGHCSARAKVAILIPFRNRWQHLSEFLLNVHPFLQKQEVEYTIYVINQADGSKFNRGMLFNIGAVEASKIGDHDCYIFHDVDLLPENDKNLYRCPEAFQHYSVAVDKFNYNLPYPGLVGGVLAANKAAFEKVNGYSNLFFGWGGEDDDFSARISANGYKVYRYGSDIARYKMIKHQGDAGNEANPQRFKLLEGTAARSQVDGLNSLVYHVTSIDYQKLYTLVNVVINQQEVMNKFSGVASQAKTKR